MPAKTAANERAPTKLSRALIERPARRASPMDMLRLARREFLAGNRVDVGAIAVELGIGRATAFRWIGSRELLIGEVLWSLCKPTLQQAAAGLRSRGARRIADLCERAIRQFLDFAPLRDFIAADPDYALRLLTSRASPVQARTIEALRLELQREVERGALRPPLPLDTLAYLIVRLGESFLYADVISGQPVDVGDAGLAVELLLSGTVQRRRGRAPIPGRLGVG